MVFMFYLIFRKGTAHQLHERTKGIGIIIVAALHSNCSWIYRSLTQKKAGLFNVFLIDVGGKSHPPFSPGIAGQYGFYSDENARKVSHG